MNKGAFAICEILYVQYYLKYILKGNYFYQTIPLRCFLDGIFSFANVLVTIAT